MDINTKIMVVWYFIINRYKCYGCVWKRRPFMQSYPISANDIVKILIFIMRTNAYGKFRPFFIEILKEGSPVFGV